MNNEELKKKIVEVLFPVIKSGNISCNEENACKRCWFPCEIERTAGRLADALIAAGIGDVKEAEHRAARAERAGKIAASKVFDYTYEEAVAQAEKELAEERKDD